MKNVKTFIINDNLSVDCWQYETRNSWGHRANLVQNGRIIMERKIRYYNRTWESFTYESILQDVVERTNLSEDDKKNFFEKYRNGYKEEANKQFGFIAGIAKLGEILCDNQKDKNNWKERMIRAGMGENIIMPSDWPNLLEEEKEKRLNAVINEMTK